MKKRNLSLWPILAALLGIIGPLLWYQFSLPWLTAAAFGLLFFAASHWPFKYCLLLASCFGIPASYQTLDWLFDFNQQFGGEAMGGITLVYSAIVVIQFIFTPLAPLVTSYVFVRRLNVGQLWWMAPVIFTLFEAWRARVLTGLTLGQPGYWLIDTPFSNLAPVLGSLGVTFVSYLLIAYCVTLIRPENSTARAWSTLSIGMLLLGTLGLSQMSWTQPQTMKKVRIVHDAAGLESKNSATGRQKRLQYLMSQATPEQAKLQSLDLVLWPEGSVSSGGGLFNQVLTYAKQLQQTDTELLTGAYLRQNGAEYNAVVAGKTLNLVYKKRHLIPYGEYIPDHPWLVSLAGDSLFTLAHSQLKKGDAYQPTITVGDMELRALICFEILFGYELARQLGDFDALLYFSDLSWVNNSLLPSQSLLMARMRAIEFAKPVVGVSNLGFSGYIDSSGQVIASAQGKRRQNLDIELTGQKGITPYAQFIDSPLVSLLFASIVLATLIAYRRKILLNSKQMETLYEH